MTILGLHFNEIQLWLLVIDMLIRIAALFIVPRNRRPSSGTAWLLFIFLIPIPAMLLFFIIGSVRLPRKRRRRHAEIQQQLHAAVERRAAESFEATAQPRRAGLENAVKIAQRLGAFPMASGNHATLHSDYHESIAQMAAAIDSAKEFVHVEFYIMVHDETTHPVFAALQRATARGLKVRVLIDHISALQNPGRKRTRESLVEIGAEYHYMLPVRPWRGQYQRPDLRNHRKLLVIDGRVAFMGSQNLVDSSYNKRTNRRRGLHWKDLMVRIEGPAALELEAIFQADWYAETGERLESLEQLATMRPETFQSKPLQMQVLPSGPGYGSENNLQVFVALMYTAQRRISITSPYFIPDGALMSALRAATARGVEVELFVSEIGDQPVVYHAQRSYYEELLQAGVKIYMFRPPFILHSKHFTIDDDVAVIGSSNMDQRSFNLNFEISLIVYGAEFVQELDRVTDSYRANSRELTHEEWSQRSLMSTLFDNLARLTSALQ